jgi:hypothetical protein
MFTNVKSAIRRVEPVELNGRALMKVVYVQCDQSKQPQFGDPAQWLSD